MRLRILNAVGRSYNLDVSPELNSLDDLRRAVAAAFSLPIQGPDLERLKLVKAGVALTDDASVANIQDGDTLLAAVAPRPPPQKLRDLVNGDAGEVEDEADALLRLQLGPETPFFIRRSVLFLKDTLRVPEPLLALLLSVKIKFWLGLLGWMALVRVAAHYELGPPVIVATCFALMALIGFGQRASGSLSAYSIFNENFERLPGQLTAEHMDGQLRRGQM